MTAYTIPYVTTRTNLGERTVDVFSRLLAERVVFFAALFTLKVFFVSEG